MELCATAAAQRGYDLKPIGVFPMTSVGFGSGSEYTGFTSIRQKFVIYTTSDCKETFQVAFQKIV